MLLEDVIMERQLKILKTGKHKSISLQQTSVYLYLDEVISRWVLKQAGHI